MLRRGGLRLVAATLAVVAQLGCGGLGGGPNTDTDTAPFSVVLDGQELLDAGNAAGALDHFDALLAQHPGSTMAERGRQDALRQVVSAAEYEAEYEARAEAEGADSLAWYLHGRSVIERPGEARESFQRAHELDPRNAWAVAGLAYLYYRKGDIFSAITEYEDGVRAAPRSATMRRLLGNQYLELKLYVHARRHLDVALRLAPDDLEVRAAHGKALLALQEPQAALQTLEAVYAEEPRLHHIFPSLAALYLRNGRPQDADALYRQGLQLGLAPDDDLAAEIRGGLVLDRLRKERGY